MKAEQLTPAMMSRQEWLEKRVQELEEQHQRDHLVIERELNRLNRYAETCRKVRETLQKLDGTLLNIMGIAPSVAGIAVFARNDIQQRIIDIDNAMRPGDK